jgi:hypothetical protein
MSRLNPLWTASRLNEALANASDDARLELGPDGRIEVVEADWKSSPGLQRQAPALTREMRGRVFVEPMTGSYEFDTGFRKLPPFLAFLSINPEPWCSTMIASGALELIGPFMDYPNPLWEWLVRAARADRVRIFPFQGLSSFLRHSRRESSLDKRDIPLPDLVHDKLSGSPAWLRSTLDDFEFSRILTNVESAADATAVAAGLMEMHDLSESHELAQSIEGRGQHRAGDYWHAIHHRREPDPSNAKYWLRKVGSHPIHTMLATASRSFLSASVISDRPTERDVSFEKLAPNGVWDPFAFVDLCSRAIEDKDFELAWAARQLQFLEMTLLLDSAHDDATTSGVPAG